MTDLRPQDFRIISVNGKEAHFEADSIEAIITDPPIDQSDDGWASLLIFRKGIREPVNLQVLWSAAKIFVEDWYESKSMKLYRIDLPDDDHD